MKKILSLLAAMCVCSVSFAQSSITLDLKDAPVRTTLEMMFKQAGIKNYVIENSVAGFVTMNLTDQPFENSLKLVMRAATVPLTYVKENDVWIVKQRIITPSTGGIDPVPNFTKELPKTNSFEVIHLNYIDPYDLMAVLGNITFISQFQRFQGGMNGSGMGNFGSGNNNSSFGGNGGFGGQSGNGMGGGAMGGFGGMMGGMGSMGGGMGNMGLGGGRGGFGGGRNF